MQAAPEPHAAPAQQDTSHFFKDDKGKPISLLSDPLAYIKAIGAAANSSHVAGPAAPATATQAGTTTLHVAEPAAPTTAAPTPAAAPAAGFDPTQFKHQLNDVTSIGIAAQLATYSRGMTDTTSKAFIQTLDKIEDPDLRHKVMAQFETQTGQTLDGFIRSNKDWNNNGDNRDKTAALQLISKERDTAEDNLAKLKPEERAKKEDEADKIARDIVSATSAHDHSDENMQKIFRGLGGRTPEEIELIRAKVRFHTHGESNLYQKIDDGTHKGDEDEAVAMLAGDPVAGARAALANEDDPKRLREVVTGLKPADLDKLRTDPDKNKLLARITNPSDRAEIDALLNNNKAGADAEHIGNLLKPKREGMAEGMAGAADKVGQDNYDRRKPANVLKELEGMSGEDVKAAAAAWGASHPGEPSFEAMLQTRWGDDSDKTEYNRILAMIHGDKGKNRSLRVQEGMRENDQDEIEGALAYEKVDPKALQSTDPETRKKAEAQAKALKTDNASFEQANVDADQQRRQVLLDITGHGDEVAVGRSTKDQLTAHYDSEQRKDIGGSAGEAFLGGDAAKTIHTDRQNKHNDKVRDDRVGAMEMLADGQLSTETQVHRGKGAKEKAEALEGITSNKELAEAQKRYSDKYGKEMLPYTGDDRKDMNANELMMENIRLYGVKAERPAQVEYLLQLQQYEKQYSKSLEMDEAGDAGGGTQRWQRQELANMHDMLKGPKPEAFDHQVIQGKNGLPVMVDNPNEPTFDQIDKLLPMKGQKVEDGLKDGVSKHDFSSADKGMTEANKAEEGAKKRLADRIVKIFSTIAKIAAALTAQPELIALIDIGEGLIEMGVKWQVMGEAYDPAEDAKMLAFTAAADIALMGFSKAGKMKGELAAAERQALGAGEKTASEMEHAVSGEAKAEALKDGAHVAAGESTALKGAVEEGASAEKALGSEAASSVGSRVEQKAANAAEGRGLHEGETAAAKTVEGEGAGAAKEALSPQELAQQIEKRYSLAGAGSKMAIQTVGGGIVQGKSPSEILKGLVTGGLGLVLPGHLSEKVKGAIGSDSLAQKILGEVASFGTEFTANTSINVAGGGEAGDVMVDQLIGLGGARAQRLGGGGHAAPSHAEEQVHGEPTGGTTETTTAPVEPTTAPTSAAVATLPTASPAETLPTASPAGMPSEALAPAVHERVTQQMPAVNEPVQAAPVHERTTLQMPAVNEPVQAAPVHERTTLQMPAVNEPVQAAPIDERTTQQMPAVNEPVQAAPIHERTTENMQAVVPPSEAVAPAAQPIVANSPAKEAQQAFVDDSASVQERIDRATGVDRGDVDKRHQDWEAMYAQQELDAQHVTHVEKQMIEPKTDGGFYQAHQNYDVRRFHYDNAVLTNISIDAHMAAGPGVTKQDLAAAKASTFKGVDAIANTNAEGKRHTLPDGSKLHVEPEFHDNAADANHFIELQQPDVDPNTGIPIENTSNQAEWKTNDVKNPATAAHEAFGHGVGFPDTYVDPETFGRATPTSPGVTNNGSFMETIRPEDRPHMTQDHLDQLGRDIGRAEAGAPQGGFQSVPNAPPLGFTPAPQPAAAEMPKAPSKAPSKGWEEVAPEKRTNAKTDDPRRVVAAPQGEMVISGSTAGPNGEHYYILENPVSGEQEKVPARWVDGQEPAHRIDEPLVVGDEESEEQLADDSDRTRTRSRDELQADEAPDIINTERDQRPHHRETEDVVASTETNGQVPEEQVSFKNGKRVPYGTKGSVRPDGWVVGTSLESKNYDLSTPEQQARLVKNIASQAKQRDIHLPPDTEQHVTIDVRGQKISEEDLMALRFEISGRTNGSVPPESVTFLTDDGDNRVGAVNTPMDRQGNFRDGDTIDPDNKDRE